MSDGKKAGFFRRLFKRKGAENEPEATAAPAKPEAAPEPETPPQLADHAELAEIADDMSAPAHSSTLPEPERAAPPVAAASVSDPEAASGWFGRLRAGLSKSSRVLTTGITDIFTKRKLDDDTLQELEDVLIQSDLGVETSMRIAEAVAEGRYDKEISPEEVKAVLAREVAAVLTPVAQPFEFDTSQKPFVILVVGVNGSGKTTTIGKLGAIAVREGYSVMLAACDTFRAAAIEQLKVWGERFGGAVLARPPGSDASGLAFDALKQARADGTDILIVDTAGRLQNKAHLMEELNKIVRVLKKQDETAPHSVLLVLDATTGQNAVNQVEIFQKTAGVTGLIMTKLDGTARGGILVALAAKFGLPVHAIGVGEGIDDLQPFDAEEFSRAIAGSE
ncbi:MAG: signal recognition particle-docking protein FtsY [Hyphomicrobiales bacterium]